jgi:hypothetical protein
VAVDEGVKAGGVGNDFLTGPGRGGRVNAQMAQTDDDVCAQGLGLVDGLLGISEPLSSAVFLTLELAPVSYIESEATAAAELVVR